MGQSARAWRRRIGVRAGARTARDLILLAACSLVPLQTAIASPLAGQLVPDPGSPSWLRYHQGGPFFLCAPGNPEDFLYRGILNPDGTRNGDQTALIDTLSPTGANGLYLMAVRSHGGDGDSTHNPFVGNDPAQPLNAAVLDQWEGWFTELDDRGIVIFFFLYDDSARIWGSRGDFRTAEETAFVSALVDRFEHHRHLIWVIAEEYQEKWSATEASMLAQLIRDADDHDHPIAVHQLTGLTFDFGDDPVIDQFAIQDNAATPASVHANVLAAWGDAAGRFNLNMAEPHGWGTGDSARRNSWAAAMAGAYVMHLEWDIVTTPIARLNECGFLRTFMESTDLLPMAPDDSLALAGTDYVLADPGHSYIAYGDGLEDLGLADLPAARARLRWLDTITGDVVEQLESIAGGDTLFTRPAQIGNEAALYVTFLLFADGFESGDTSAWARAP